MNTLSSELQSLKNTVHTSCHLTAVRIVVEGFLAGIGLFMLKYIVFNVVTHCSLFEGPETPWHPEFFGYILGQACHEGLPCNHLNGSVELVSCQWEVNFECFSNIKYMIIKA